MVALLGLEHTMGRPPRHSRGSGNPRQVKGVGLRALALLFTRTRYQTDTATQKPTFHPYQYTVCQRVRPQPY
jgi:hypothetical protein